MKAITQEIDDLQEEIHQFTKADVEDIRQEIDELREIHQFVKADMEVIRQEMGELNEEIHQLKDFFRSYKEVCSSLLRFRSP